MATHGIFVFVFVFVFVAGVFITSGFVYGALVALVFSFAVAVEAEAGVSLWRMGSERSACKTGEGEEGPEAEDVEKGGKLRTAAKRKSIFLSFRQIEGDG